MDGRKETLEEKVRRTVAEEVAIVPYDPHWPQLFAREKEHLQQSLPADLIGRIEHFGSTAVPGLAAKPIIDMLVEVRSLDEAKDRIAPILETQGYDYFWRPTWGDDIPPFYAWFIRRNDTGQRTHHIHMVESHFEHWQRLLFRDYLIVHPEARKEYQELKYRLAETYPNDRVTYTKDKTDFIVRVTSLAKKYFNKP